VFRIPRQLAQGFDRMPRRGFVSKRVVSPIRVRRRAGRQDDPRHHARRKGAGRENVVYGSLDVLKKRRRKTPVAVLKKAIENVKPVVEVKSRRVGGAPTRSDRDPSRAAPVPLDPLARRVRAERAEKTMIQRLSGELLDAYNNRGNTFKKKEDTHKMAEANKAFAHYRW